jgi:hypothetical protein
VGEGRAKGHMSSVICSTLLVLPSRIWHFVVGSVAGNIVIQIPCPFLLGFNC